MNSKIIWCLVLFLSFVFLYFFTIERFSLESYTNSITKLSSSLTPSPDPSNNNVFDPRTNYKTDNYDVEYHEPVARNDDTVSKGTWVKDPSGNLVFVPWNDNLGNNTTYYTSGAYPYGASTYVPNYEDSVYLSKTTGKSTVGIAYTTSASLGICNQNTGIDSKAKMEQSCNALTSDVCASTTCCTLLGGSKCVSGDSQGPYMKANYNDPFVKNKDYYYYSGKCYGRCE